MYIHYLRGFERYRKPWTGSRRRRPPPRVSESPGTSGRSSTSAAPSLSLSIPEYSECHAPTRSTFNSRALCVCIRRTPRSAQLLTFCSLHRKVSQFFFTMILFFLSLPYSFSFSHSGSLCWFVSFFLFCPPLFIQASEIFIQSFTAWKESRPRDATCQLSFFSFRSFLALLPPPLYTYTSRRRRRRRP